MRIFLALVVGDLGWLLCCRDTIWALRMRALEKAVLSRWETFTVWNAGKQGRRLYRSLAPDNRRKVRVWMCVCVCAWVWSRHECVSVCEPRGPQAEEPIVSGLQAVSASPFGEQQAHCVRVRVFPWRVLANSPQPEYTNPNVTFVCHMPKVMLAFLALGDCLLPPPPSECCNVSPQPALLPL